MGVRRVRGEEVVRLKWFTLFAKKFQGLGQSTHTYKRAHTHTLTHARTHAHARWARLQYKHILCQPATRPHSNRNSSDSAMVRGVTAGDEDGPPIL